MITAPAPAPAPAPPAPPADAGRTAARRRATRGAALVEMSIVALLLFILIFGIISYGFMMSFRQALTQAAAEGARAGAVAPVGSASANAVDAINESLSGYGLKCSGGGSCDPCDALGMTCTVSGPATCANNATRQCITVHVTYAYGDRPLLPAPPFLNFIHPDHLGFTSVAETNQ